MKTATESSFPHPPRLNAEFIKVIFFFKNKLAEPSICDNCNFLGKCSFIVAARSGLTYFVLFVPGVSPCSVNYEMNGIVWERNNSKLI